MACVCATLALPQAVFVFSGFIRALPRELEEAAVIDGCTPFMAFWRIVFPLLNALHFCGCHLEWLWHLE